MIDYSEIQTILSVPKTILITSHRNPDGDAIGSSLGLFAFLKKLGHNVKVAFPSEYPSFFNWMENIGDVLIYDTDDEQLDKYIEKCDLVFALDYNSMERIDKLGEKISTRNPYMIMIDHHLYPENFADQILSDPHASSTSELIFELIKKLNALDKLSTNGAEALLTGIITDTGSFQYNTRGNTFRTAADLQDLGAHLEKINFHIFSNLPEKNLRLLGHCLNNRMELIPEYHTGIIFLNKHDFKVFEIGRGDTEGIVNYLLKIKDIHMAVFIQQQPTIVKLSFRSKGELSVEEIARKHFNGGGHKNASGGYVHDSIANTINKIKSILPQYKDLLNQKPFL